MRCIATVIARLAVTRLAIPLGMFAATVIVTVIAAVVTLLETRAAFLLWPFAIFAGLRLEIGLLGVGLRWIGVADFRLRGARCEGSSLLVLVPVLAILWLIGSELRIGQTHGFMRCRNDTQVMFAVLEIVFSRHVIASGLSIAAHLQVFFSNMLGSSTDFNIWPVGFVAAG